VIGNTGGYNLPCEGTRTYGTITHSYIQCQKKKKKKKVCDTHERISSVQDCMRTAVPTKNLLNEDNENHNGTSARSVQRTAHIFRGFISALKQTTAYHELIKLQEKMKQIPHYQTSLIPNHIFGGSIRRFKHDPLLHTSRPFTPVCFTSFALTPP